MTKPDIKGRKADIEKLLTLAMISLMQLMQQLILVVKILQQVILHGRTVTVLLTPTSPRPLRRKTLASAAIPSY